MSIVLSTSNLTISRHNLQVLIRSRKTTSAHQARELITRRVKLAKQIATFNAQSPIPEEILSHILNSLDEDDEDVEEENANFGKEESEDEEEDSDEDMVQLEWDDAENLPILVPSRFDVSAFRGKDLESLLTQEKELREAQMNDSLHSLRQSLGDKAWVLRNRLRNVKGYKERGNIQKRLLEKSKDVGRHLFAYNSGRQALLQLGHGADWEPITKTDLRLSSDVAEANRLGQKKEKLPWFWRIEEGPAASGSEVSSSKRMEECQFHCCKRLYH